MVDLKDISQTQPNAKDPVRSYDGQMAEPRARSDKKESERYRQSEGHHKREKSGHRFSRVIWDFKFELLALVFMGGGIFLLLAPFKITPWALGLVAQAFHVVAHAISWFVGWILSFDKSDIGGVILVTAAFGLLGLDIRTRILRRHEKFGSEPSCSCGHQMHRARTTLFQYALATLFRVRIKRFLCSKCHRRMALWQPPLDRDW